MKLKTPLSENDIRRLKLGETLRLDGIIYTGRDEMHMRALEHAHEGRKLPYDLKGAVVFHTGPLTVKDNGKWKVIAAGPTTSSRMNSLEAEFIQYSGVRAIIGKGGMSQPTVDAMARYGCVYLAFTGGAAVLAAEGITGVRGVEWLDLGAPEALWALEVKGFGPLIVGIDAHGNSLYKQVDANVKENLVKAKKRLGI